MKSESISHFLWKSYEKIIYDRTFQVAKFKNRADNIKIFFQSESVKLWSGSSTDCKCAEGIGPSSNDAS